IYTFEQPPSDGAEKSEAPFIIIEGTYEDTDYPSFYRIDFVERQHEDPADPLEPTNEFLPLVRNYSYNIRIKEILGPGYRSLEDAATCKPFNTVSEVFRFDDNDAEAVQFDGKYFLSVSREELKYDKEESTQPLVVKTDSPLGWEIEDITYSGGDGSTDWLTMDKTSGTCDDNGEIHITAAAYNPAGTNPTPREATFKVISGRMEYTIQVVQSHLVGISLEILTTDGEPLTELLFRSNPRENNQLTPKSFKVKWSGPAGCNIEVAMLGDRVFPFERTGANAIYTGRTLGAGEEDYTFSITPTGFTEDDTDEQTGNPFLQDGATVTFRVSNREEEITKNIYIRHQCISIVFTDKEEFSYMGSEDAFTVYSNTAWELSEVKTEATNLFLTTQNNDFSTLQGTTGGYNTQTGTEFIYRIKPATAENGIYSLGRSGRKMYLTFRDTEGTLSDKTISFFAATPDPNCHLLPGGSSLRIPLRKLFWVWEKELGRELNPDVSGSPSLGLSARIL
ncbi:MAG: BACON domain-containing protein, partial [Clostridium sp.]|nr:BACON domain-containing protein [Clostridium sp.]